MPTRHLVIVNPGSGTCDREQVENIVRDRLGDSATIRHVPEDGNLLEWIEACCEAVRPDALCVAGGDGTVSAVATVAMRRGLPLGVLPMGTANLLARELHIPFDASEATDVIARGHHRSIDAMEIGGRTALCRVSFGTFSEIGGNTSSSLKQRFRRLAYGLHAIPKLFQRRRVGFEIWVDGRRVRARATFVVVTNVGDFGFANLRWAENILPDDGKVDIMVVRARGLLDYLRLAWSVLTRRTADYDRIMQLRARERLVIRTSEPVAVLADGEPLPEGTYEVRVRPGAMRVFAPDEAVVAETAEPKLAARA